MFKRAVSTYAAITVAAVTAITVAAPVSAQPLPATPAITPGAAIGAYDTEGQAAAECTLGFLATGTDGGHYVFTAGHCDHGGNAIMPYQAEGSFQRIGKFAMSENGSGRDPDIATIRLATDLPTDTRVLSRRPVTGVTSAVNVGDTLCFYGMRSGRQCGQVQQSMSSLDARVSFVAVAVRGDSGAPVYRIGTDGNATAVGILDTSDRESGVATATLIEPVLKQWGLTLDTTRVPGPALPVGYQPGR
jgi:hypothetical protein